MQCDTKNGSWYCGGRGGGGLGPGRANAAPRLLTTPSPHSTAHSSDLSIRSSRIHPNKKPSCDGFLFFTIYPLSCGPALRQAWRAPYDDDAK